MTSVLHIPTERLFVYLSEVITLEDEIALLLAARDQSHPLNPDQEGAPDHNKFLLRQGFKEAHPTERELGLWVGENIVGLFSMLPEEEDNSSAEVAYDVFPQYQRQGLATVGLKGLVGVATSELGISEIIAEISPSNVPSQKVVEKVGFQLVDDDPGGLTYSYRADQEPVI